MTEVERRAPEPESRSQRAPVAPHNEPPSRPWSRIVPVAGLILGSLGCGSGTGLAASAFGGGDDPGGGPGDGPTVVGDLLVGASPDDLKASPLSFTFRLTDAESDPADIEILYAPPAGGPVPALLVGDTTVTQLATSPSGVVHTRHWDFAGQLPSGASYSAGYTLAVRLVDLSSSTTSPVFDVGNDAPLVAVVQFPTVETSGIVPIDLLLTDSSSDPLTVTVEYDDFFSPTGWKPVTALGGGLIGEPSSAGGTPALFLWDTENDEPDVELEARLRFTPDDGLLTGTPVEAGPIVLDNNAEPVAIVHSGAFFATPDERRGIPIGFDVIDDEGDPVTVAVQWRDSLGTFASLPADPASLAIILGDPVLAEQHGIATEAPLAYGGFVVPVAATTARLLGLLDGTVSPIAADLVGRELQILRPVSAPATISSSWAANPLSGPAAALPVGGGKSAFVLDSGGPGTWRLREVDLATGTVLAAVATGAEGDPDALAWHADGLRVLLAARTGVVWTVLLVDPSGGTATPIVTADGTTELGAVRGLAPRGDDALLLTVGDSLISVDFSDPVLPVQTALIADFDSAFGLALDPRRPQVVYVADRDWVNPATSVAEGRVVEVDLASLARTTVPAAGVPLLRPEAIALERSGTRLLAVTDEDPVDGTRELRGVALRGGGSGAGFEVAAGYPDGTGGIASGPDGLRILVVRALDELSLGGGLEQVRDITGIDLASAEATVSAAFDPALAPDRSWRVRATLRPTAPGATSSSGAFVWDTSDLPQGGDVVVRVVPYDAEKGVATDTGVPRTVRAGIDVVPAILGGPGLTQGPAAVVLADLDADGDLDVADANAGGDSVTLFYQVEAGQYPSLPDDTLTGTPPLTPMTMPSALVVADVDDDGDVDIVTANPGSDNITIFTQSAPATFVLQLATLAPGTTPRGLVAGDLDGDGALDLVSANGGSDDLAVFLQLGGGLYPATPSLTVGDATTVQPADVATGDLDGDGALDFVSVNEGSENVTGFLQQAPGVFAAAPDFELGGPGLTAGPTAVAVGDVDSDGLIDLAVADTAGNDLGVFFQATSGLFPAAPDQVLSGPTGPVQPVDVVLADLNGDGFADLVSANGSGDVTVFSFQDALGGFVTAGLRLDGNAALLGPTGLAPGDVDGDGSLDLVVANGSGDDLAIFLQRAGAGHFAPTPDRVLGNPVETPRPEGLAIGDLDGDGDLDLVTANRDGDGLAILPQLSAAVFSSQPTWSIQGDASLNGPTAVRAADLDGDGLSDLATANADGGSLAILFQGAGGFPPTPDAVLGSADLGGPAWLEAADLDGDGDADLVSVDEADHQVDLFFQNAPGVFSAAPDLTLGGAVQTVGAVHVVAADLDADGDLDLAVANAGGDDVAIFLQAAPGVFPSTPDALLGSAATTADPRAVAAGDLDADGDLDLATANAGGDDLAIFLQSAPGVFPPVPDLALSHAASMAPRTLALLDVDLDGDTDVTSGNEGTDNLTVFRQTVAGAFSSVPDVYGGFGSTDSPRSLVIVDLDGDGDPDLVCAHPALDNATIFFASH